MKLSKTAFGLVILVAILISLSAGYYYGHFQGSKSGHTSGEKDGYSRGETKGFGDGYSTAQLNSSNKISQSDYDSLVDKYNTLVKSYNLSLHTNISCYSTTYGINSQFMATNCY